jgi:hypothetical protein
MFSPLHIFFGESAPASPADWQLLSSELDVDFDVMVLAFCVPRVLAAFHESTPSVFSDVPFLLLSFAFERHQPRAERDGLK